MIYAVIATITGLGAAIVLHYLGERGDRQRNPAAEWLWERWGR